MPSAEWQRRHSFSFFTAWWVVFMGIIGLLSIGLGSNATPVTMATAASTKNRSVFFMTLTAVGPRHNLGNVFHFDCSLKPVAELNHTRWVPCGNPIRTGSFYRLSCTLKYLL